MKLSLLVADDDPLIRVLIAVSLEDVADTVDAADGNDALRLLRERRFDAAIVDWDMPGRDGVRVVEALRKDGSEIPVIMLTAQRGRAQIERAIGAGASDYVIKPFSIDILREKVLRWRTSSRVHSIRDEGGPR